MSTNTTTAPVANRWESYDLNIKNARALWSKETSENCVVSALETVAYKVGAVFVAALEGLLNVFLAAANAVIWAANGINNYFNDKKVEDVTKTPTPEKQPEAAPAPVVAPAPAVVAPVVVVPAPAPVAPVVVAPVVSKVVPAVPTKMEWVKTTAKNVGSTILSYSGTALSRTGIFVYTALKPVRNLEGFMKDAYQVARHPVVAKNDFKNWYYGPAAAKTATTTPAVVAAPALAVVATPAVVAAAPALVAAAPAPALLAAAPAPALQVAIPA